VMHWGASLAMPCCLTTKQHESLQAPMNFLTYATIATILLVMMLQA
jgi:hypothetical protein